MRAGLLHCGAPRLIAIAAIAGTMFFPSRTKGQGHENEYTEVNLVSSGYVVALVTDHNLINPWGMIAGPTTPLWISNQATNTATIDPVDTIEQGTPPPLTVAIPTLPTPPNGPTGIVFNLALATNGFGIPAAVGSIPVPSAFIFADLNGTILGWSPKSSGGTASAVVAVNNHAQGAVYTGLAMATVGSDVDLYAANVTPHGGIQVFNSAWQPATNLVSDAFRDPDMPELPGDDVWAPYNIANLNGQMYVAYVAIPATGGLPITGKGLGFIGIFTVQGQFVRNVDLRHGRGNGDDGEQGEDGARRRGELDTPWGMAMAPAQFGRFSNDLLVGNFGNGEILAFRPDGRFDDSLRGSDGQPLQNGFLWTLWFGNGAHGASPNTLYITTGGFNQATDGLFAAINPEP